MTQQQQRFSFGAVIVGFLVDTVGSVVFSILFAVVVGLLLAVSGYKPNEIEQKIAGSVTILSLSMLGGLFFSIVGGFVSALIARHSEVLHGAAEGVLAMALGIVIYAMSPDQAPVWFSVLGILLNVPAAAFGGYLRQITKSDAPPPAFYGGAPPPPPPPQYNPPPADGGGERPKWGGLDRSL